MLKHRAVKDNFAYICTTPELAQDYANQHEGYTYQARHEWRYYDATKYGATDKYTTLTGGNLIDTIENNFVQLIKSMQLYGPSGYRLHSAKLVYNGKDAATLTVEAWPFSNALVGYGTTPDKTLTADNIRTATLNILDVTPDEMPEAKYIFEIKKSR